MSVRKGTAIAQILKIPYIRPAGVMPPAGGDRMFGLRTRAGHYAILAVAHLVMTLPNLGVHSLWDMDEGVNAESAREMLESATGLRHTSTTKSARPSRR